MIGLEMSCKTLNQLLSDIRDCQICAQVLPYGPRPVVQVSRHAKILLVGQAPGRKVHDTGIPFNDPSGDRLRDWLGVERDVFYDAEKFNIVPMGFCFPGTGKSGDLPPRKECAPAWRQELMTEMTGVELTIIIGQYAMAWHLEDGGRKTVTETVQNWKEYWPSKIVLPHPSPRNNIWLKKNEWFETEILPLLKAKVSEQL